MTLEKSAVREVTSLFGNESALRRIISLSKKIKKESRKAAAVDDNVMTAEDKNQILAEIKQGLIEVKMAKEGKIKLETWKEFKDELHG